MQAKHISTYILVLVVGSLLCLTSLPAQAQQRKVVTQPADTVPLFRGLAVSIDALGVIQKAVSDYGQYEAALRVNLKDKYFPIIELGLGKADANDVATSLHYKTSAPYGRIGCDFNILKNKHDIYRLYGGFRYAFTSYKYDLEGPNLKDPIWGDEVPYGATDVSCNYHWIEGVFTVDARIWGPIRMGWSLRYRRRLFNDDGPLGNTWYVPGYGKQGSSRLGGTFNISFEL